MKNDKQQPIQQRSKKLVRKYYEQVYVNKLDNLEEMDKFLEAHSLPSLSQEETGNLNRPITGSGLEFVTKKRLPAQERLGLDGFTEEF